jgi:hypothetical protein
MVVSSIAMRTIFFTLPAKILFFKDLGDKGMACPLQNIEPLRVTGKVLSNNDLLGAMNLGLRLSA